MQLTGMERETSSYFSKKLHSFHSRRHVLMKSTLAPAEKTFASYRTMLMLRRLGQVCSWRP